MKDFDKIIKQAVEGHEAPFDPQMWDKVSSQLNSPLDQAIKDSVDKFEAPYNPAAWTAVSGAIGGTIATWKWIAGSAAAASLIIGSVYFFNQNEEKDSNNSPIVEESNNNNGIIADNSQSNNINEIAETNQETLVEDNNITNDGDTYTPEFIDPVDPDNHLVVTTPQDDDPNFVLNEDDGSNTNNTPNQNTVNSNDGTTNPSNNQQETDVVATLNPSFTAATEVACVGEEFIFTPSNINQKVLYMWNYGDGSYSSGKIGKHTFKTAGEHTVTLTLVDAKTNEPLKSKQLVVTSNPKPTVDFTWEQSRDFIPTINFVNLTEDGTQHTWDIKGIRGSTQNEFQYTFTKAGTYMVELTSVNEFGCAAKKQKTIEINEDYNLLAPTAFTPNGDGNNDTYIPEALKILDVQFTMTIYSKDGAMVYQTNSPNEPWDGLYMTDNIPAPDGAYVWHVQLTNEMGEIEVYQGQVIITR